MYLEKNALQSNTLAHQEPMNDALRSLINQQRLEVLLLGNVTRLNIADFAVAQPGYDLSPDQLTEAYRLVPLEMVPACTSKGRPTKECRVPVGVESNYNVAGGTPYLDTRLGLGLVYNGVLGAVGGAEVSPVSALTIVQLQGVNTADPKTSSRYQGSVRGGLMAGLAWHDTLVRAWEYIASNLQLPLVEIQGATKNAWVQRGKVPKERLMAHYDSVAERMSYTYDPKTKNWQKPPSDSDLAA